MSNSWEHSLLPDRKHILAIHQTEDMVYWGVCEYRNGPWVLDGTGKAAIDKSKPGWEDLLDDVKALAAKRYPAKAEKAKEDYFRSYRR